MTTDSDRIQGGVPRIHSPLLPRRHDAQTTDRIGQETYSTSHTCSLSLLSPIAIYAICDKDGFLDHTALTLNKPVWPF